ncbi:hypothetical protein INT45_004990 [Circinella minor]|uniref:Uncharacterized protein n=1 Tax=Circinella minor TaxID=1195481 RepID=A0A8H7VR91_9FUNG|nr:hypothetical protein INT45_004990 [Circinella minor]
MPYGRNNNKNVEEEELIEVSSPACYMGLVDWDYGFDNFFSKDIANRRRSCQKPESKQLKLETQAEEDKNTGTSGTSSTPCHNNNSSTSNSSNTNSCGNNQGNATTLATSTSSEPQQPKQQQDQQQQQQQEQQQQPPDQKETNKQQQKQQDSIENFSILSSTVITAPIGTQTNREHNNDIFEIKKDGDGTTEEFSDYFGDGVNGDEWTEGAIFDDEDDDFGELTEFKENEDHNKDTCGSDLLNAWEKVLTQVYLDDTTITGDCHDEWISPHGPKSIRHYVLEEAHESVHSKVTWTSVTYSMDQDTGIARVKWPHSKIEEMYLHALDCERLQTTAPFVPAMLSVENEDDESSSDDYDYDYDNDNTILPSTPIPELPQTPSSISYAQTSTVPTSIKSPLFGGFSFSKLLPRLSTTSLPRSDFSTPTSATSTQRYSIESIPRTSDSTGTTSPDKNLSRTASPIPYNAMTSPSLSPSSIIIPEGNVQTESFNTTISSPTTRFYQNESIIPKSSIHAKRYSMPVTTNNNSNDNKVILPTWKSNVHDDTERTKEENQPPHPQQQQQRRRPMTMIDTTLANKSFSILDLDDVNNTTIISTPPPSSRSFSFTPLVPTPTRATSFVPLVPTPTRGTTLPMTPKMDEQWGTNEGIGEKTGNLHDLIIGSIDSQQQKHDLPSPLLCGAQKEDSDMEFGEFTEAVDDGFGDFVLSDGQEQEDEWGDWNGCNTTTAITSH